MKHSYPAWLTRWLPRPLAALGLLLATAGAAQAQTTTFTYTAPGGTQTYSVPAGVTKLTVVATGGGGGRYVGSTSSATVGAVVTATVTVVPGEMLTVVVGGQGGDGAAGSVSTIGAGGYNGGGTGNFTGGGGGATDLRRATGSTGDYLTSRNALLVAGGGGGADGGTNLGGNGGATTGGNGSGKGTPGQGATSTAPGGGGVPGTNGTGGNGGGSGNIGDYNAGGGGGYYGGGGASGGGTWGAGGGGGSSFVLPTGASNISYAVAAAASNGALSITPLYAAPTLAAITPNQAAVGTSVTLTGGNLTGATAVTFAGTSNNTVTTGLTVGGTGSSQTLTVLVPTGATTGSVTVTTPGGTSNGLAFTVLTSAPTVNTALAPSTITSTSAGLGGNVTASGGVTVTDRGVVYSSTNQIPTTNDTKDANGTGTGSYLKIIGGLTPATTYYVRAYATNSAGTSYGPTTSFTTLAAVSGTTIVTSVSCNGGSNGTINLTPSGGVGPYTYRWNDGPTTEDRTGLSTGYYSVVITDATGATGAVNNIFVTQPSAISLSTSQTNIACNGASTGAASVSTAGGTSLYTYLWSTGATTPAVTGLTAGNYSVVITNANGCTTRRIFTLTQPATLTATTSQTNVTTNGGTDGSAAITVGGGTPSYTYSWSPRVSTSATATGLGAGTYTVTAADVNGCTIARSFTITEPTASPVVTVPANGATTNFLPTFAGTAPAGSTVTIYVAPSGGAAQAIGTTTATGGSFGFTPTTVLANGSYSVYANAQTSGQLVSANSNTNTFTVDATPPTAAISSSAGSSTSTAPIPFTVSFSEPVTNFTTFSVQVTNGTLATAITNVGNDYSFSIAPTSNGLVTVSVLANSVRDAVGNANTTASSLSVTYTAPITATNWTGAVSTDWFDAANWSAGVPTATVDATISPVGNGRYPLVSAGTATTRNLTINSGASLSQSGGTLDVRANLTNNSTFVATGGTVVLGTSTLGNLVGSGTTNFWSLQVESSGAALATSAGATVQQALTLNGGFATNGNSFVLRSNATGTALVVNNGNNVVNGTTTVERYIDPSVNPGLGYRHYSSPVTNSTVGDLTTSGFTPVVNPAYNTVPAPANVRPYPTVFGYDDSRLATASNNLSSFDKGYFSPAALSDALVVGRGYTVNIAASELVDFQGTLNNGDLPLTLTSTRNTYPDGGWQFLGNPYPAPLNYAAVAAADRAGLESAIYVYSSTSQYTGRYRTYVNGIGNPVLPVGQGFFARVAAGLSAATMNFRNSQRLTTADPTTFQRPAADPRPLVQLTLQGVGAALVDEAYVYFEQGATTGFEPAFDAEKLANPTGLNLSTSLANGHQLSIDGQPELGTAQRVVPLAVGVPTAGVYTLAASQLLNLGATPVYLRDVQLGTLTDLRQQPTYQFTVSNASALLTGRFELVFSPQQVLAAVPAALAQQVALYPNPARGQVALELPLSLSRQPVTVTLLDALGRVVRQQVLPAGNTTHSLPLTDLATGIYALRLHTSAGVIIKKLVVE